MDLTVVVPTHLHMFIVSHICDRCNVNTNNLVVYLLQSDDGKSFNVVCRLDTAVELEYYKHGGILQYVIRKLMG